MKDCSANRELRNGLSTMTFRFDADRFSICTATEACRSEETVQDDEEKGDVSCRPAFRQGCPMSRNIKLKCSCGTWLDVGEERVGKVFPCPECGAVIWAPSVEWKSLEPSVIDGIRWQYRLGAIAAIVIIVILLGVFLRLTWTPTRLLESKQREVDMSNPRFTVVESRTMGMVVRTLNRVT